MPLYAGQVDEIAALVDATKINVEERAGGALSMFFIYNAHDSRAPRQSQQLTLLQAIRRLTLGLTLASTSRQRPSPSCRRIPHISMRSGRVLSSRPTNTHRSTCSARRAPRSGVSRSSIPTGAAPTSYASTMRTHPAPIATGQGLSSTFCKPSHCGMSGARISATSAHWRAFENSAR